jgi:hypothetical protein
MRLKEIFLISMVLGMAGCSVCGEQELAETNSPNAHYGATVFRRGCGATSAFLYHVNLRSSGETFSSDSRGVIEDGQVFLTDEGKITLSWKDEKTLLIDCDGCPTNRKPLTSWKDVGISYQVH